MKENKGAVVSDLQLIKSHSGACVIWKLDALVTVFIGEKEINLTAKEYDVLELLAMNPNKVYSRENLLNIVWGYEYPGDVRTVDVHILRLRKILQRFDTEECLETVRGIGYRWQE